MKRAKTLMLCGVCLALTACGGWRGAGAPRIEAPQEVFMQPCAHPSRHLRAGDWEVIAGRIGDALIECEAKRSGLAAWAAGLSNVLQSDS